MSNDSKGTGVRARTVSRRSRWYEARKTRGDHDAARLSSRARGSSLTSFNDDVIVELSGRSARDTAQTLRSHVVSRRSGGSGSCGVGRPRRPRGDADGIRQVTWFPAAVAALAWNYSGRVTADLVDEGSGR